MKSALVFAAMLLAGCASYKLPAVNAGQISYRRTDPLGGTQVEATNVRVEDGKVKAETASWVTTYPSFSVSVQVRDYERPITP